MEKVTLTPAWAILESDPDTIKKVYDELSFRDKGAESDLVRFKKGQRFRQSRMEEVPEWYKPWYDVEIKRLKDLLEVHACILSEDGSLMVPIGLLGRLESLIGPYETEDLRNFDVNKRHLGQGDAPTLRKPQEDGLAALRKSNFNGLVKIATGVGKTTLAQQVIEELAIKAVFLVPTKNILSQTFRRFKKRFGAKNVGEFGGGKKEDKFITVATYQSIYAADTGDFDDISLMIGDEIHHVAARTFYDVAINKLRNAVYRIGLTADEERADGATLLVHSAVGEKIYDYSAKQGIEDGFLARPTHFMYSVGQTYGTYKKWKTNKKTKKREDVGIEISEPYDGDDADTAYKNWVLGNDYLNNWVAKMALELAADGHGILILVDEIEHGEKLRDLIPNSRFVQGGSSDNEEILADFNARILKIIIGTSVIGEGTDIVPVDYMFQLQGGASESRARQADGRMLRNDPDPVTFISRKPTCVGIDFTFPLSSVLNRHSGIRADVHRETGDVHDLEMR
jgi:superfamily II DNA or RNA helicase